MRQMRREDTIVNISSLKTFFENIKVLLSKKVDRVPGHSLMADAEIERLADVTNYDDTGLRNELSAVDDRVVDIEEAGYVPENTIEQMISDAISGVTSFKYEVVSSLPETGAAGIIYLMLNGSEGNKYDEYVWVNNEYEKIGPSMEAYMTRTETMQAIAAAGTGFSFYPVTLGYDTAYYFVHDNERLTYQDVLGVFNDPHKFLYLIHTNLVFLPAFVLDTDSEEDVDAVEFTATWIYSGKAMMNRVIINEDDQVKTNQYELEEAARKVASITGRNTDNVHYPSTAAIVAYVQEHGSVPSELVEEVNEIAGVVSEDITVADLTFVLGNVSITDGTNVSSTTRIRTDAFIPAKTGSIILADSAAELRVVLYSDTKPSSFIQAVDLVREYTVPQDCYIRIAAKYASGQYVPVTDIADLASHIKAFITTGTMMETVKDYVNTILSRIVIADNTEF